MSKMTTTRSPIRPLLASALGVTLALALVACDRNPPDRQADRTAGEKVDAAVDRADAQADRAQSAASAAAGSAMRATGDAARAVSTSAADTAITARVKAGLAAEPGLPSTAIRVETSEGRTLLQGQVADGAIRDRASRIAAAVQGVVAVDNQLIVAN